jgi:RNA polymerase sigma factor (sigma-70 family)
MRNDESPCATLDADGRAPEPTDRELLRRFCAGEDAAFALLIQRHGPMVLGVCRRVLNQQQDAEDAFQTTFLVLVRKAGSITRPELVGNWLYGVAYRTARKARARLARQRQRETGTLPMSSPEDPHADLHWHELRALLDTELKELPGKYRTPLVLCYLEGMTNEQAASHLGWPTGSISYRLARGRELLRQRLRARNRKASALALGLMLSRYAGPPELPDQLAATTMEAVKGAVNRGEVPECPHELAKAHPPMPSLPFWQRHALTLAVLLTVASVGAAAYSTISTAAGNNGRSLTTLFSSSTESASDPSVAASCHSQ